MSQLGQFISVVTGVTSLTGDSGGALTGALKIKGGNNITTAAAGTDITVNVSGTTNHAIQLGNVGGSLSSLAVGATGTVLTGVTGADPAFSASPTVTTIYAGTFDTNVAAAGVTLSGTTLSADGTDVDININITAKGAGKVIIDDLQLTTDLAVTEGGTGVSTLTDHGLLVGSGAAAIDALSVGATGTILTGVTGADPTWTTATYPSTVTKGDVLVASANNVVGVVNDVVNAGYVLTANAAAAPTFQALPAPVVGSFASDAETIAGAVTNKAVAPSNLAAKLGSQTLHALPIGAGSTAALNWLAVGANGETLMGSTGADCSWTNSPQFGGSVTATNDITSTAGSISSLSGSMISRDATNTSTGPSAYFQKVRVAATIQSGDELGKMRFTGYDGTGYITGAKITSTNSGTVATNRIAGDLQFYTHPDSVVALPSEPTLRMTIASTGATTIASPDSGVGLTVSGGGITCTSGAITATSGDVVISAGNLLLPTTNSTTAGNIKINGNTVLRQNDAITTTIFLGGAGAASTACSYGTGVGYQAMGQLTASMDYMTCVGYRAGYTAAFNSAYATYIGSQAGGTGGKYSTCVGYNAGSSSGNNSHNVYINNVGGAEEHVIRIGTYGSGENQQNLAYIAGVLHGTNGLTADTGDIVATSGNLKLPTSTSTVGQIQFNSVAFFHNYQNNLFIGSGSGNFTASASGNVNTCIGTSTGSTIKVANGCVCIGYEAGKTIYDGGKQIFIGYQAGLGMQYNNSGTQYPADNIAIGAGAMSLVSGNSQQQKGLAIGTEAHKYCVQNSDGGVAIGYKANSINTNWGTVIGNYACQVQTSVAGVVIGTNACASQTSGAQSVIIGESAGSAYVTGSSNICIHNPGVNAETNTIHIGTQGSGAGQQNKLYIAGAYGVTPGGTQNVALVDSNGQFGSVATLPPSLGGAMTWTEVTGTSQAAAVNNGYITNNVALVTVTLPSTAAVGQRVAITGNGAGLWSLAQNSGQTVHFGSTDTTTGVGGSISATVRYDCIEVQCITANTDWVVIRSVGTLTIV